MDKELTLQTEHFTKITVSYSFRNIQMYQMNERANIETFYQFCDLKMGYLKALGKK